MGVSKSVFISQGKELKDRLVAKMIKVMLVVPRGLNDANLLSASGES
jgi:hypothetical protein